MDWPLVLAGPILRRVTPHEVSVWIALKEPRSVHLYLFPPPGPVTAPSNNPMAFAHADTVRLGDRLHVALVTIKRQQNEALSSSWRYWYDVAFGDHGDPEPPAGGSDLFSEGLLKDVSAGEGRPNLALGYADKVLPSFVVVPNEITGARILHGSCRKMHGGGEDALAWVDGLIGAANSDTHPHQLFLTGDQIYADEVPVCVLDIIHGLVGDLMGAGRVESVSLDDNAASTFAFTPANFPPGFRQDLMKQHASFSTSEGHSHLVTFGEFAAMYLLCWSNTLWPENAATNLKWFSAVAAGVSRGVPSWHLLFNTDHDSPLFLPFRNWLESLQPIEFEQVARGDTAGKALIKAKAGEFGPDARKAFESLISLFQGQYGKWLKKDKHVRDEVAKFYNALPAVRRALANVPVYMVADDHEITDDWNVTAEWQQRVTSSPLGRTILRNGLASYVAFQAWGNDPEYWATSPEGQAALQQIQALSVPLSMPAAAAATALDTLFGIQPDDHDNKLRFHFSVPGPKYEVYALDTRTARKFDTYHGTPRLLSETALAAQLPTAPVADREVIIAIAPGPVLSPAVIEETVWPALMRIWDTLHAAKGERLHGYEEWDAEAWAFNPLGFEQFIAKMATYKRAVILSGDVHYAISAEMDYFYKQGTGEAPSRIVQFTSSGLKNSFPAFAVSMVRGLSVMQQFLRFGAKIQRLAWSNPQSTQQENPLDLPQGSFVSPQLRAKLRKDPVLIPTHGWPKDTKVKAGAPPDWSWRFNLIYDLREDNQRPWDTSLPKVPDIDDFNLQGYFDAGRRHIQALDLNTNKRSLHFDSNVGLIVFSGTEADRKVEQRLYSIGFDGYGHTAATPAVYALHVANLFVGDAQRPAIEYLDFDEEPVAEAKQT